MNKIIIIIAEQKNFQSVFSLQIVSRGSMHYIFYHLYLLSNLIEFSDGSGNEVLGGSKLKRAARKVVNVGVFAPQTTGTGPLQLRAHRLRLKKIMPEKPNSAAIITSFNKAVVRRNLKDQHDPWTSLYIVLCQIAMDRAVSSAKIKCTKTIERGDTETWKKAERALKTILGNELKVTGGAPFVTAPIPSPSVTGHGFGVYNRFPIPRLPHIDVF